MPYAPCVTQYAINILYSLRAPFSAARGTTSVAWELEHRPLTAFEEREKSLGHPIQFDCVSDVDARHMLTQTLACGRFFARKFTPACVPLLLEWQQNASRVREAPPRYSEAFSTEIRSSEQLTRGQSCNQANLDAAVTHPRRRRASRRVGRSKFSFKNIENTVNQRHRRRLQTAERENRSHPAHAPRARRGRAPRARGVIDIQQHSKREKDPGLRTYLPCSLAPADIQYTLTSWPSLRGHHSLYLLRYSQRLAGFGEWSRRVLRRVVPSPSSPSSPPSYASTGGLSRAVRNRPCGASMSTSAVAAVLHLGDRRSAVRRDDGSVLARALALLLLPIISTSNASTSEAQLCRVRLLPRDRSRLLCSSSQAGQLLAVGADALRFRPRPLSEAANAAASSSCTSMHKSVS